jgi:hypothetical protein
VFEAKKPTLVKYLIAAALSAAVSGQTPGPARLAQPPNPPLLDWKVAAYWAPGRESSSGRQDGPSGLQAETGLAGSNPLPLAFVAIPPCRLFDTRASSGLTGAFGPPSLVADPSQLGQVSRVIPVPNSTCGIPVAAAYSLYFVVVPPSGGVVGFLSAWPDDQPWPGTAVLNAPVGGIIGNSTVVPAGSDGGIQVSATNPTDLVIDINGYFLDRPAIRFRGAWNAATAYAADDVVSFTPQGSSASSYLALAASQGVEPDVDATDGGVHWGMLAQAGAAGAQGSQGPPGMTGAAGPSGPPGSSGPSGPLGPQGIVGPAGPTGAQGIMGLTGVNGPTGPAGPTGPPASFQGVWTGGTTYSLGDAVFLNGSSYVSLSSGNTNNNPTGGSPWALLAQQGSLGATGAIGPAGATGPAGPQGATGASGPAGATGATGALGPAGPTGTQGATGVQGPAGATGATGAAGAIGPSGPQGTTGAQGPAGATGASGPAGAAGSQGATGSQGPAGATGATGAAGATGTIYGDGSDGTTTGVCNITVNPTNWVTTPPSTDVQCTDFTVASGVTLTVPSGTLIHATGAVTVTGTITVQPGAAQGLFIAAPVAGNSGNLTSPGIALPAFTLRKLLRPGPFGGGNGGTVGPIGTSGYGGGSIVILAAGLISITGSITANGANGTADDQGFGDGGGAGGIVILASKTSVSNTGSLSAIGGNGSPANSGNPNDSGGGGGGGLIHLLGPSGQVSLGTNHFVTQGSAGSGANGFGSSFGGGAMGGNGGAGSTGEGGSAGAAGLAITTTVVDPATLFVP